MPRSETYGSMRRKQKVADIEAYGTDANPRCNWCEKNNFRCMIWKDGTSQKCSICIDRAQVCERSGAGIEGQIEHRVRKRRIHGGGGVGVKRRGGASKRSKHNREESWDSASSTSSSDNETSSNFGWNDDEVDVKPLQAAPPPSASDSRPVAPKVQQQQSRQFRRPRKRAGVSLENTVKRTRQQTRRRRSDSEDSDCNLISGVARDTRNAKVSGRGVNTTSTIAGVERDSVDGNLGHDDEEVDELEVETEAPDHHVEARMDSGNNESSVGSRKNTGRTGEVEAVLDWVKEMQWEVYKLKREMRGLKEKNKELEEKMRVVERSSKLPRER